MTNTVNMIVACDSQYGIGIDNELPWPHNDTDMKWFRDNTINSVIIMGRKTWESIGFSCLPKRVNIVVSTQDFGGPDEILSGSMIDILNDVKNKYPSKDIWFIGGSNIYEQAHEFCDNVYLTQFDESYKCDSFIDLKKILRGRYESCSKVVDNMKFSVWSK